VIPAHGSPRLSEVVSEMLSHLKSRLPAPAVPPIPPPSVSLVRMTEQPVGLGQRRGNEARGPFPLVALKGGRLDAVVRFQLWADGPNAADAALLDLQQELLRDRDELVASGFLRLESAESPPAERVEDPSAWRRLADYRLLYEFHYAESEGADSLIARIPVAVDGETTVIDDRLVRWDEHEAPSLEVRCGGRRATAVDRLHIVASLPDGWDGAGVTEESFSAGIHRSRSFDSVRELLEAIEPDGEPVELGGRTYRTGRLRLTEPVTLRRGDEYYRLTYAQEKFDSGGSEAVVYLRALG